MAALAAVRDRDRRRIYARHIQDLDINYFMDKRVTIDMSALHDVELPQLKRIYIEEYAYEPGGELGLFIAERCIRPSLEEIDFECSRPDEKCVTYCKSDVHS